MDNVWSSKSDQRSSKSDQQSSCLPFQIGWNQIFFYIGSCEILSFAKTIEISCEIEFKKKGERKKIRENILFRF